MAFVLVLITIIVNQIILNFSKYLHNNIQEKFELEQDWFITKILKLFYDWLEFSL